MERFFAPDLQPDTEEIVLPREESRHLIKSFRKRQGDHFLAINGSGLIATCTIISTAGQLARARILKTETKKPTSGAGLCIALSTLRPRRLDWAVEKLTELGVGTIQLLTTRHTSIEVFKRDHLQKIAVSALKQSQQGWLPQILPPRPIADWLPKAAKTYDCRIAYQSQETVDRSQTTLQVPIAVIIGPEGGFHSDEIELAADLGCSFLHLGPTILRSETAAVCAAAIILSQRGQN